MSPQPTTAGMADLARRHHREVPARWRHLIPAEHTNDVIRSTYEWMLEFGDRHLVSVAEAIPVRSSRTAWTSLRASTRMKAYMAAIDVELFLAGIEGDWGEQWLALAHHDGLTVTEVEQLRAQPGGALTADFLAALTSDPPH